jgi:hypothetical protein
VVVGEVIPEKVLTAVAVVTTTTGEIFFFFLLSVIDLEHPSQR